MNSTNAARLVVSVLNDLDVPFMIVGSLSSNYYAIPRSTKDADFVVQTDDRIDTIRDRLSSHFRMDPQVGFETKLMTTKYVFRSRDTPFIVELFVLSSDPHDQQRFARRIAHDDEGLAVFVPTAEDVIIQKLRWARLKDKSDVADIIEVQDHLDWRYIEQWCGRHGTRELLDAIRADPASFE